MKRIEPLGRIGCVLFFASALGCAADMQDFAYEEGERPTSLQEVEIPKDFDFATTRVVAVELSAQDLDLVNGSGLVEVSLLDGGVLYRGPITSARELNLTLSVPTKDSVLEVTLLTNAAKGRVSHTLAIEDDVIVASLGRGI